MSKEKRYIKNLTESQIEELELGYKYGENNLFRSHCQAIILSSQGHSVQELMKIFQCRKNTIYDWFNNYESQGIQGLRIKKGRGRKAKLQEENTALVKEKIEENRQKLALAKAEIEKELNKKLSQSTLKRFLKNLTLVGVDSEKASKTSKTQKKLGKRRNS